MMSMTMLSRGVASLMVLLCCLVSLVGIAGAEPRRGSLSGRVLDQSGAVVRGAVITLRQQRVGFEGSSVSDGQGQFRFQDLLPGSYEISVRKEGFTLLRREITAGGETKLDLTLAPGGFVEEVTVVGTELVSNAEVAKRTPGSVEVIDTPTLQSSRVFNFSEALRKAAGLNVRDEEGFGLRPNIGLRGLNPTRSSKLLLLEDGVPLAYAVYGDNASYYHPPLERFSGIEVLKGSGQIQYGPSTIGGVINYLTPEPPPEFGGSLILLGGNRAYFNGMGTIGGSWRNTGILLNYMRKQGDGARENVSSRLNDVNFKLTSGFARHTLAFKANYYGEDSNVTYSGLRLSEYLANPRQNPFRNDFFDGSRWGASLHHTYAISSDLLLSTKAYGSYFRRDWWRQSSNSAQRPNDQSDPNCGGMANLNTTCGNEGRLRNYTSWGIEPHLRTGYRVLGVRNETDFGVRAHFEIQDRQQQNGPLPTSRSGVVVENNERRNQAYSAFVHNRLLLGKWTISPGLRVERIFFERTNRLANAGTGIGGRTNLTQLIPGAGVAYAVTTSTTLFGGVHRGFAPPRTEDIISNTGGVVDLDPELSWNYELGIRSLPTRGIRLDATWFRMDYENQIIPASLAGGLGAALTNAGQTLHQGFELTSRVDTGTLRGSPHNLYFKAAYTYLPVAKFTGQRFSNVPGFTSVSVTGNRLPYAPENLLTGTFGYAHPTGIDLLFEAIFIGDQFGDDLNTVPSSADGQRGLISGNTTWNMTANYHWEPRRTTFFVTVKNLLNDTFLVDRSRGMLPNSPRLVQAGAKLNF